MSLNCFFSLTKTFPSPPPTLSLFNTKNKLNPTFHSSLTPNYTPISRSSSPARSPTFSTFTCRLALGFEDVATIAQNKVLIAAGVSAAIGQLLKPFTSVLLYGNSLDFRPVIQAGGFPSTHSSAVVATATSLALERGFSDSIFGLTVVYAALVMYDAQGVRREVGIHAKTINRALLKSQMKSLGDGTGEDIINSDGGKLLSMTSESSLISEEPNARRKEQTATPLLLDSSRLTERDYTLSSLAADTKKASERSNTYSLLKESVGHSELEVIAGALLGFLVSLTVEATL